MRSCPLLVLVLTLAFPNVAAAGELPVSYLVEQKPLKDAVAGTSLTFELFTDQACSGSAASSSAVAIDAITMVSKLTHIVAKGADKPPNVAELRATLPAVAVPGNVWLRVTGTGIVPFGDPCQAQSGQVASAPFDGALSTKDVVLLWGGHFVGQWSIETPTDVGLLSGSIPVAVDRAAAVALQNLDTSTRQACRIELVAPTEPQRINNMVITQLGTPPENFYIPIFGLSGCRPACSDGVRNGKETDVDCGGDTECARCPTGGHCSNGGDCASGQCVMCQFCAIPLCQ